jgi:predicted nucleic acid-binding protein
VTDRVVVDSSALAALVLDAGTDGNWVAGVLIETELAAPSLVGFETADIIRRQELAGLVSADQAHQAHADLLDLTIEWWPYELLAPRAWRLRDNLSIYEGSYVALAELLETTLVTLDRRIAGAPGVGCAIATPPADRFR